MKILRKIYNASPKSYITGFRSVATKLNKPGKQNGHGIPAILTEDDFRRQAEVVGRAISSIRNGDDIETSLKGFHGFSFGERVAEYPAFAAWLLKSPPGLDILDIGCVLNNQVVSDLIMSHCDRLWLLNPAQESMKLFTERLFYHLSPLEKAFSRGETFPLVTCMSTIEHIGYDNSHYGVAAPAMFDQPSMVPFTGSLRKIASLLAPGGRCFVTVPFGKRELVKHPLTSKFSSQVFDATAIREGISTLRGCRVEAEFTMYAATDDGWRRTDPDSFSGRYAHGTPGASGVAILEGVRTD